MLQKTHLHILHRALNKRILETASWKARTFVGNGETTQALLVWSRHSVREDGTVRRKLAGQYKGVKQ